MAERRRVLACICRGIAGGDRRSTDRSVRLLGGLLVLPLLSVSALAWASGNPFNGVTFAGLSFTLATIVRKLPARTIRIASGAPLVLGVAFVAFGWIYPHFLATPHWSGYLIAAPLGLLPCPTLSAIIGLTLIVSGLESVAWSVTLAGAAILYSAIGVIRLAVAIDIVLFAGAATLIALVVLRRCEESRADANNYLRALHDHVRIGGTICLTSGTLDAVCSAERGRARGERP